MMRKLLLLGSALGIAVTLGGLPAVAQPYGPPPPPFHHPYFHHHRHWRHHPHYWH